LSGRNLSGLDRISQLEAIAKGLRRRLRLRVKVAEFGTNYRRTPLYSLGRTQVAFIAGEKQQNGNLTRISIF
jgi:hypothetical protein